MHSGHQAIAKQIKDLIRHGGPGDDREFLEWLALVLKHRGVRDVDWLPDTGFDNMARLPMATEDTFKQNPLPREGMAFLTSGTTQKRRGVRPVRDYDLYRVSVEQGFSRFCMYEPRPAVFISLVPSARARPESSLSHMASILAENLFETRHFFRETPDKIRHDALWKALELADAPVFVFSTQADLSTVITRMQEAGKTFSLPEGSRVMFTGGPKGRGGQVYNIEQLIRMSAKLLDLETRHVLQEFGMTELFSQAYDVPSQTTGPRCFRSVPWLRNLVVDPGSMKQVPPGQEGLLLHLDLANCLSEPVLLSSDIALRTDDGFVPLRRVPSASVRGCSQDSGE